MRVRGFHKIFWNIGCFSLLFLQAARAQLLPSDSVLTFIEVDQLPRSDSVRAPAAAFDARGNFAVAWVAYERGQSQILLRLFDAIGRPLTEIRPLTERSDTLAVAHPHLTFTPEGFLWLVWDQTTPRQTTEAVAQILQRDLKPFNKFILDPNPAGSTSRPHVACDPNGRVIVAWILDTRPAFVTARFFKTDGSPEGELFPIDQSGDNLGVGGRLSMSVSGQGIAAITWHGLGDGEDRISLRLFDNPRDYLTNKETIATRNVAHPTLAFLSSDELIMQWYALERTALLRAQRFDLNGQPVALPFDIAALDTVETRVVVAASEQPLPARRSFVSFWTQRDPQDRRINEVFGQAFFGNQEPITKIQSVARTSDISGAGVEIESVTSSVGNYLVVFTGNDQDRNSTSPRIGARLTQVMFPDLQIANLAVSPANPRRADSVKISFSVLNAGPAPAAASTAFVEFINTKLDTLVIVPPLAANGLANFTINMGTLAPGNHTLRVTLDHTRELPELDESNNRAGFPFKVEEAPRLVIQPEFLEFAATFGQSNPAGRILTLSNAGSDTAHWRVAVNQPWLLTEPAFGSLTTNPAQVTVNVSTSGLPVGSLAASLLFSSNGGNLTIPVTLTINPPLPSLLVQPRRLEFAATQGGSNPPAQDFTVQNRGGGTLVWNAASNQSWLAVTPVSGTTTLETDQLSVGVSVGNLLPGQYAGKIFLTSNGGQDSLEVLLNVSPRPPALEISPTVLNFVTTEGTSNPPAQAVYIRNTGGGTLEWSADENEVWLSLAPRSGQTRANVDSIRVFASISMTGAGSYSSIFTINSNGGAQSVRVNFLVNPRPVVPDLVVENKMANLENCYTADYRYVTEFIIYNFGDGVTIPVPAHVSVNNQIRHSFTVPALNPGETFDLSVPALLLSTGFNTILCEVDASAMPNESVKSNNAVTLLEWVPQRGDANLDSLIDLRDLFYLADLILERVASPPRREIWAANVAIDTTLDIVDMAELIDRLLSDSGESAFAASGGIALRLSATAEAHTRCTWQSDVALRAWQVQWHLSGGTQDHPPRSARFGNLAVHWKIQHRVLSVLILPAALSASVTNLRAGEIVLPLPLTAEDLAAASGLSQSGELLRLEAHASTEAGEPPLAFLLSPAFPNPVQRPQQRAAAWRYELPVAAAVEFKIFNLLGQEVRHAALGWQPAGRGQWQWDGRDQRGKIVANGSYFVEFRAGSFRQHQRLLLH